MILTDFEMTYSRPAYTYTPDVVEDSNGQEHLADTGQAIIRQTGQTIDPVFEIDDETGERIYQDIPDPEATHEYSTDELYINAINEAYPDLQKALAQWSEHASEQDIEHWNNLIDTVDPEELMPMIEGLMADYYAANPEEVVEQHEIDSAIDNLTSVEPEGTAAAYEWLQVAEQATPGAERDVMLAVAEFHKGNMSASEAISSVLAKGYPMTKLKQIYNTLTSND